MLTQERLKEVLSYNPLTGVFLNRMRRGPRGNPGREAGWLHPNGYVYIQIDGRAYRAHQLVFLYEYGAFPEKEVDHIDGWKSNNVKSNLRLVTRSENCCNTKVKITNRLGIKNVSFHKRLKKYSVTVMINNYKHYLGLFEDLELAELVATEARDKYHGKFARQ